MAYENFYKTAIKKVSQILQSYFPPENMCSISVSRIIVQIELYNGVACVEFTAAATD